MASITNQGAAASVATAAGATSYNTYYQNTYVHSSDNSTKDSPKPIPPLHQTATQIKKNKNIMVNNPNFEMTLDESDRLQEYVNGTTTVTTQMACDTLIGYNKPPGYMDNDSAADHPTRPGPGTDRFYNIELFKWDKSTTAQCYRLPTAFLGSMNLFTTTLKRHALYRCGWDIIVQANASKFHSGCLLVAAVPEATFEESTSTCIDMLSGTTLNVQAYTAQLTLFPHQFLNIRTNNIVHITLPYLNHCPFSSSGHHDSWTLVVIPVVPLNYPSAAPTTVKVNLSIAPKCSEFHGLRNASESLPVYVMPNQSVQSNVECTDVTPVYTHVDAPTKTSLPTAVNTVRTILQTPTLICNPSIENNVMTNATLNFEMTGPADNPDLLLSMDVTPTSTHAWTTSFARIANHYSQWRGSIQYTFMYCGPAMGTCKLMIAYTPPGVPRPTSLADIQQATTQIWDLGIESSATFITPFYSNSTWRSVVEANKSLMSANGYISIIKVTDHIVPPGTSETQYFLGFVQACDDFEVRFPADPVIFMQGDVIEATSVSLAAPEAGMINPTQPNDETHLLKTLSSGKDMQVETLVSHFRVLTTFSATADESTKNLFPISIYPVDIPLTMNPKEIPNNFDGNDFQKMIVTMFTYWKSDLQVMVKVKVIKGPDVNFNISYLPFGAGLYRGANASEFSELDMISTVPTFIYSTKYSNSTLFTIPYTSAMAAQSSTFCGFGDFAKTKWGVAPSNLGTLRIKACESTLSESKLSITIYIKPINVKVYCPRPILAPIPTTPLTDTSGTTILIKNQKIQENILLAGYEVKWIGLQGGEAETIKKTKPIWSKLSDRDTLYYKQQLQSPRSVPSVSAVRPTISSQGLGEWLFPSVGKSMESLGNLTESMQDSITEVRERITDKLGPVLTMASDPTGYVVKAVLWYIASTVIMIRAGGDLVTAAALATLIGHELIDARGLFSSVLGYLKKVGIDFGTCDVEIEEPPTCEEQGVENQNFDSAMRSANSALSVAKGIEWAINLAMKFVNWIQNRAVDYSKTKQGLFDEEMKEYDVLLENINILTTDPTSHVLEEFSATEMKLGRLISAAVSVDKQHIVQFLSNKQKLLQAARIRVTRMQQETRPEPVAVVFYGSPGCGKSLISNLLANGIAQLEKTPGSVYSLPPDADHLDGYLQQKIVVVDDLGQNPDGKDFSTFCQMVSTVPFVPAMADLSEKGITYTSPYLIATSNLAEFRPVTVTDPAAVARRFFKRILVKTKPYYANGNKRLNARLAMTPCDHTEQPSEAYKRCCPLLCGLAVELTDENNRKWNLNDLVETVYKEGQSRQKVNNLIGQICHQAPALQKVERVKLDIPTERVPTPEVRELLEKIAPHDSEVIEWAIKYGYLKQADVEVQRERKESTMRSKAIMGLCGLAAVVTSALAIWKIAKHFRGEQAAYAGPKKVLKKNVENFKQTVNLQGSQILQTVQNVATPVDMIISEDAEFVHLVSFTALPICGRIYATNTHAFDDNPIKIRINGIEYPINEVNTVRTTRKGNDTDITFFQLPHGNECRNLTGKFFASLKDVIYSPRVYGYVKSRKRELAFSGDHAVNVGTVNVDGSPRTGLIRYRYPTEKGFCGAPVVTGSPREEKILGIHCAGDGTFGYASMITQDMIKKVLEELTKSQGLVEDRQPLPKELPRPHIPRKTTLRKSPAFGQFPVSKEPSVLSNRDRRLDEGVDFDQELFSKHTHNVSQLPEEFFTGADIYYEKLRPLLPKDICQPLTLEEAINGIEGMDSIELNNSPGYPHAAQGRKKCDFFVVDELTGYKTPTPELIQLVQEALQEPESKYFMTFLKDELRATEKIQKGKTRTIDAGNLEHNLAGRIIFGRLFAWFHLNNGPTIGSAVGCNPEVDWTRYYHELNKQYVFDLDYSGFDSSQGEGIFEVLRHFLRRMGFGQTAMNYIKSLAVSTHVYDGTIFKLRGALPSGCAGTSIFNTINNNILVTTAICSTCTGISSDDFKIIAYGDDVVYASEYPIKPKPLAQFLGKYGFKLTPASKSGEFPEESSIHEVTFLKRSFKPDEKMPWLVKPCFPKQQIFDSLSWTKGGPFADQIKALAMLFHHNGEAEFKSVFDKLKDNDSTSGYPVPSWAELRQQWVNNFM